VEMLRESFGLAVRSILKMGSFCIFLYGVVDEVVGKDKSKIDDLD